VARDGRCRPDGAGEISGLCFYKDVAPTALEKATRESTGFATGCLCNLAARYHASNLLPLAHLAGDDAEERVRLGLLEAASFRASSGARVRSLAFKWVHS